MSISRIRPSRFLFTKTFTAPEMAALPVNAASMVTYSIGAGTLPDRGLIHRVTVAMVKNAAWDANDNDLGVWNLHTNGTSLGTQLLDAEIPTVIGQAPFNPLAASLTGADVAVQTNKFLFVTELNFATTNLTALGAAAAGNPSREGYLAPAQSSPIYYDVSDNVLGPATNTGTLYLSLSSDGSMDYKNNLVDSIVITLEIEPCF